VSLRGVAVGRIQDSYSQVPRPQLVRLYAANVACALIAGLGVALPVTGAAFAVALGASCVAVAGCDTPTIVDSLVPVVALGSWPQPPRTSVCSRSGHCARRFVS
jgi:hypothetical protein